MESILRGNHRIPAHTPNLTGLERKYLLEAFDSSWISSKGKFVEEFEQKFSRTLHTNFSLTCSSGTTALHLALLSIGIKPGDEVIIPDFTFAAVAHAIMYCGASPVLVDIKESDWTIDPKNITNAITDKTKAVIVVHIYGSVCDMDKINNICKDKGITVIEDCAEAIGSKYKRRYVGGLADLSIFSFFGNKTITTGEGGMVCTKHKHYADKIKSLRNHCMTEGYYHTSLGYNYRMTNLQAAIGLAQLKRLKELIRYKKQIAKWYTSNLDNTYDKRMLTKRSSVQWACATLVSCDRDKFIKYMSDYKIEVKPTFQTMSSLPHLKSIPCSKSNWISRLGVCLPSGTLLREQDVKYICEVANNARSTGNI